MKLCEYMEWATLGVVELYGDDGAIPKYSSVPEDDRTAVDCVTDREEDSDKDLTNVSERTSAYSVVTDGIINNEDDLECILNIACEGARVGECSTIGVAADSNADVIGILAAESDVAKYADVVDTEEDNCEVVNCIDTEEDGCDVASER